MKLPLLYLDVDGPLNPWDAPPHRRPDGYQTFRYPQTGQDAYGRPRKPLRVWLNPSHGERLLALPFSLVWGTAWHDANEWIGPKIGLPELPAVELRLPERWVSSHHWKLTHLIEYAAGRPFAWVDDAILTADDGYVAENHPAPALLHWVSPRLGLLEHDFKTLTQWSERVTVDAR
jgi:hypothetical protein